MPGIVYLQFTNPAGYPPLEHSSRLLADRGWDVLFLGSHVPGVEGLAFPPHRGVTVRMARWRGGGARLQLSYLLFVAWTTVICLIRRPAVVYASELLSCLPALMARGLTGCRVIYHEHDAPDLPDGTAVQRAMNRAYFRLARTADLVVIPQEARLGLFLERTDRTGSTVCVPNLPLVEECAGPRGKLSGPVRFYFHGSLNEQRLPLSILDALATASKTATLTVVGYETSGSSGYMTRFLDHAASLGLGGRVIYAGTLPRREDMLARAGEEDVGLAFMPVGSVDVNMANMAGASNKPFDYLSQGLMLLVSDLPGWRTMFVEPGYGMACDPANADSLARAMAWCAANPAKVRAMGEAGRKRVTSDWNYETALAPVMAFAGEAGR